MVVKTEQTLFLAGNNKRRPVLVCMRTYSLGITAVTVPLISNLCQAFWKSEDSWRRWIFILNVLLSQHINITPM